MRLFSRLYRTPQGFVAWCQGCGNCIEAETSLALSAGISGHLRRKHRTEWSRTSFSQVFSSVRDALRRAA